VSRTCSSKTDTKLKPKMQLSRTREAFATGYLNEFVIPSPAQKNGI